jgi:hypothetical protein
MARKNGAASDHGPQGTKDEVRVARAASLAPADDPLLEFLAVPANDPRDAAPELSPGPRPRRLRIVS